jgi:hypothetical protein
MLVVQMPNLTAKTFTTPLSVDGLSCEPDPRTERVVVMGLGESWRRELDKILLQTLADIFKADQTSNSKQVERAD